MESSSAYFGFPSSVISLQKIYQVKFPGHVSASSIHGVGFPQRSRHELGSITLDFFSIPSFECALSIFIKITFPRGS